MQQVALTLTPALPTPRPASHLPCRTTGHGRQPSHHRGPRDQPWRSAACSAPAPVASAQAALDPPCCRLPCAAGSAVRAVAGPAVGPSPHRPDRRRSGLGSCHRGDGRCPYRTEPPADPACARCRVLPATESGASVTTRLTKTLLSTFTTSARWPGPPCARARRRATAPAVAGYGHQPPELVGMERAVKARVRRQPDFHDWRSDLGWPQSAGWPSCPARAAEAARAVGPLEAPVASRGRSSGVLGTSCCARYDGGFLSLMRSRSVKTASDLHLSSEERFRDLKHRGSLVLGVSETNLPPPASSPTFRQRQSPGSTDLTVSFWKSETAWLSLCYRLDRSIHDQRWVPR